MKRLRTAWFLGIAGILGACSSSDGECVILDPRPDFDYRAHQGLGAADMNGDGLIDLVYATRLIFGSDPASQQCGGVVPTDGSVTVRQQDPMNPGTFLSPVRFTTLTDRPGHLTLADLNADARPDVIVTSRWDTASFEVLLHDAVTAARLGNPQSFPTVDEPHQVAVGDIDRDGRVDLAIAGATRLAWHPQQMNGSFGVRRDVGTGYATVALTDLDGDGRLDLATLDGTPDEDFSGVRENPGDVLVYRQDAGAFALATRTRMEANLWMLAAGDLNADGAADIAAAGFDVVNKTEYHEVWYPIFRTASDPLAFAKEPRMDAENGLSAAPVIADLNGDGRNDVVLGGRGLNRGELTVFLQGSAAGTFTDKTRYFLPPGDPVEDSEIDGIVVADLNDDTLPDIAVSNGEVHVLFQLPASPGRFGVPVKVSDWRP